MSTESNKAAVRRLADEGWSGHDFGAFEDFFAETAVWYGLPPEWGEAFDAIRVAVSMWLEAFPDLTLTVHDLTAEEDRVAHRWEAEGTHLGDLMGIPPTGKRVTFGGVAIQHFEDGKCVYLREAWDQAGLMEQLTTSSG